MKIDKEIIKAVEKADNEIGQIMVNSWDDLGISLKDVDKVFRDMPYSMPHIEWCVRETVIRWWQGANKKEGKKHGKKHHKG